MSLPGLLPLRQHGASFKAFNFSLIPEKLKSHPHFYKKIKNIKAFSSAIRVEQG
jgi:hypothetical protein